MLQAIRSRASSIVVQVLFGLLILTFALWGIGDIFRGRGTDDTVATVGDVKISTDEVQRQLRQQVDRMRQAVNASLTPEQIKELGLVNTTLEQIIDQHLLDLEAKRLGLAVNDQAVRQAIVSNPAFHGPGGAFDRNYYGQLLAANQMSDQQYESLLRTDMVRNRIVHAVMAGTSAPPGLVDALWHSRNERVVATAMILPPKSVGDLGTPDEPALMKFYEEHKSEFMVPERRSFTVAVLDPVALAAAIKIPDAKLAAEYKTRADEFRDPEKRQFQQLLLPDEAKAKEAKAALDAGKDFAAIAKDNGESDDLLNLGTMKRDELPGEIAKIAFAMKPGEISEPIRDPFGWHILKLIAITPEQVLSFDQAKDKLATQMARDQAGDEIAKTANAVDDALAGGSSFDDVVKKFSLKTVTVANVDEAGHGADDKPAAIPEPHEAILKTAFGTSSGGVSDLKDTADQGYYLLHVEKVTASEPKPFAAVRDQVVADWQQAERETRLQKLADGIAAAVNGGQSLDDAAALRGLQTFATRPLSRSGGDDQVPPAVVSKLFAAKANQAVAAPIDPDKGFMVAVRRDTLPPDPAQETIEKAKITQQINQSMMADYLGEYQRALRQRYPVTVDQAALDRVL